MVDPMNFEFEAVGRLPVPEDNVAIATRTLKAGATIRRRQTRVRLSHTVLVGHRFAIAPIPPGGLLTSWGQPFGRALVAIQPGEYVCNDAVLRELGQRDLDFSLPDRPNFADQIAPFLFDESRFQPAAALPRVDPSLTFSGYRRPGRRGVGTRNTIVLLGTSSLTASFVRELETRLKPLAANYPHIDGIVAVAHTEGGADHPNNRELLLRTLAGFMVHPNVGAVLAVDYGSEAVTNAMVCDYMERAAYPLADVSHHFTSLSHSFHDNLDTASTVVRGWLDPVNGMPRSGTYANNLPSAGPNGKIETDPTALADSGPIAGGDDIAIRLK